MTETEPIPDLAQRIEALDPRRSFIVQAPAGSGKTELLIQRYLGLLAQVEAPEEVIAITFTRKAAGEMRSRVLKALGAARGPRPGKPHEALTWQLAREAMARDARLGWRIEDHPARLRIQTIDALCAALTRQMPVLSRFGAPPAIVEEASHLYREAARATLALLHEEAEGAPLVARLLMHLDNDLIQAEKLLASMLARRDQWLRHVASGALDRTGLEAALTRARLEGLRRVRALAPTAWEPVLVALAREAAANLALGEAVSPVLACQGLWAYPPADETGLPAWLGLAELLLTREGEWRRRVTEAQGFPAPSKGQGASEKHRLKEAKSRMEEVLAALVPFEAFRLALADLRALPPPRYTDAQWEALEAIARLLPLAASALKLIFQSRGEVDFTEVSQAALRALGDEEAPTDLALALDYRIRHLLVDEFQDTSLAQFELLRKLTAGWEPGDGRTLFVVGDPMQSIYRFREAEVGLFLRARQEGIGSVTLTPLTLRTNFRATPALVAWVNQAFARVLPDAEDPATGAVPLAPSVPRPDRVPGGNGGGNPGVAVTVHPFFSADGIGEAARVVALVQAARAEDPAQTVAILVRSRGHLSRIVPALREAGLPFRAIEIEPLGNRPVVQDLFALTRALVHPADRAAWLAVLRAPWCGLSLSDLHALVGDMPEADVWSLIHDAARRRRLSDDGRRRLERVLPPLAHAKENTRRGRLRDRVEAVWLALGGPACVQAPADLEDARTYLDCLDGLERGGDLPDLTVLTEALDRLFAAPDAQADERLQVMTIHKAKGLEFDTVIVPGLGDPPRQEERRLMRWIARPQPKGGGDLLLGPIREAGAEQDPIYAYIARLDRERQLFETGRLLYVAATRAKRRLHLLGRAPLKPREGTWIVGQPPQGSLLACLWPAVAEDYRRAAERLPPPGPREDRTDEGTRVPIDPLSRRLVADYVLPPPPPAVAWERLPVAHAVVEPVEFSWVGESTRHVGTVVHRWLQRMGEDALRGWNEERVRGLVPTYRAALMRLGVPREELDQAAQRVVQALTQTLADPRGRWLLGPHREARCEYRLTGRLDGEWVDIAIDRTFVDEEGVRWIVDYKTGVHLGGDLEAFLDRERERYQVQLERYARVLAAAGLAPIRCGLYFPLLKGWREW